MAPEISQKGHEWVVWGIPIKVRKSPRYGTAERKVSRGLPGAGERATTAPGAAALGEYTVSYKAVDGGRTTIYRDTFTLE